MHTRPHLRRVTLKHEKETQFPGQTETGTRPETEAIGAARGMGHAPVIEDDAPKRPRKSRK